MFGEKLINRVDKSGMWILLVLILAFFFTGYGMTKHIMDPVLAKYIHVQVLPIPLLIFLCIHVVKAVHNQFKKWKLFNSERVLDLYTYGITLLVAFILIWLYFQ